MRGFVTLEDLTKSVRSHAPGVLEAITEHQDIVELEGQTAALTVEMTYFLGAIIQVVCRSGGRVILFKEDVIRKVAWS